MPFSFKRLEIPDLVLVIPEVFGDERGYFLEAYKRSDFAKFGIGDDFVQDVRSSSKKGVVRGLHYQMDPAAQGKLITVLSGSVFLVAVDLRKGSPHFGKWASATLSEENKQMLWVPKGFATGMMSLKDNSVLSYKLTAEYSKANERGVRLSDPEIGIIWPASEQRILSDKDIKLPLLKDAEINFTYRG